MTKTNIYISEFKYILLMCFILFSLSPCTFKDVLLKSVHTDYAKPLNKSKTSSCAFSKDGSLQFSIIKKSKASQLIEPINLFDIPNFAIQAVKFYVDYTKTFSGNSPPKYILYKRLKIAVA